MGTRVVPTALTLALWGVVFCFFEGKVGVVFFIFEIFSDEQAISLDTENNEVYSEFIL